MGNNYLTISQNSLLLVLIMTTMSFLAEAKSVPLAQQTLPNEIAGLKTEDGWAMLRVTYRQKSTLKYHFPKKIGIRPLSILNVFQLNAGRLVPEARTPPGWS